MVSVARLTHKLCLPMLIAVAALAAFGSAADASGRRSTPCSSTARQRGRRSAPRTRLQSRTCNKARRPAKGSTPRGRSRPIATRVAPPPLPTVVSGDASPAFDDPFAASTSSEALQAETLPTEALPAPPVVTPVNTVVPTISPKTPTVNSVETATTGTWSGSPSSYSYQWLVCNVSGAECANITGASSASYTVPPTDAGRSLVVRVAAANAGGGGLSVPSAPTAAAIQPPTNAVSPSLSTNNPAEGVALSVSQGTWSGYPAPAYTYQWQRCNSTAGECTSISGATSVGYTPKAAEAGKTIQAIVRAANSAGQASASTHASNTVTSAVITTAPANISRPTFSTNTPQQDVAISITNGEWTGSPSPSFTYRWERCNTSGEECTIIPAAISSSYTPVATDVAKTLKAVVTADNSTGEGSAETGRSSAVVPQGVVVPPAPVNSTAPTLSNNSPRQGQSESVSNGLWINNPISYHYQWQDCNTAGKECSNISGATISSYTPVASDVGKTLTAVVTARNSGGEHSAASSTSSIVVAATPTNTVAPTISPASPQEGIAEVAASGSWTYNPSSYSYQWEDCNASGEECLPITGATASRYTPTRDDAGHMLMVTVTAANHGVYGSASSGVSGRLVVSSSIQSFYAANAGSAFSAPGSVWRTPEFSDTEVDPGSQGLVETLSYWGSHNMNGINTTSYSSPIYTVPAGQPTTKVVLDYGSPPLNTALQAVPMPPGATTAAGTDQTLVVYQPSSNQMWEFWHMRQGLLAPTAGFSATVSPGGSLAAGTYYYAVTALSADGETTSSATFKVVVPQPGSTVKLSFSGVIYGQGYKVYRGSEPTSVGYVATLHQATNVYGATVTYTDTGGTSATNSPPTVNTAATPGQWHASWAGQISSVSTDPGYYRLLRSPSGTVIEEPSWGSTASSLPVADGMITLQDLKQGRIDHAVQLLVPSSRAAVHTYPAQRTDGMETGVNSIPEGAHFTLDASVDCNEQVTPFMRMVCVAAQQYGFIVNDQTHSGMALRGEDPTPFMRSGGTNPYLASFTDSSGNLWRPYQMMAAFPWSHLHLLPMQLETQAHL
jgi:hypothetical protein